jgi:hypothetical protein
MTTQNNLTAADLVNAICFTSPKSEYVDWLDNISYKASKKCKVEEQWENISIGMHHYMTTLCEKTLCRK